MKIRVNKINRPGFQEAAKWAAVYEKRLKNFCDFSLEIHKEGIDESKLCSQLKSKSGHLVLIDERGSQPNSLDFAKQLHGWIEAPHIKNLNFLIGGSHGVSNETRESAHYCISLSPLVLQGDLALVTLCEQIYRGFNINAGTGYHHQ